jgi:hypothetical protein
VRKAAQSFPVVTILGPRQSGKTTLVQALFPDHRYINLENPETRRFAHDDARGLLEDGRQAAIIEEVQRVPEMLSWIQIYADRTKHTGHYILTGSNQPQLGEAVSQSLAGRTSIHVLLPLSLEELAHVDLLTSRDELLHTGLLPRLYSSSVTPQQLFSSYFATYVERDVRRLINVRDMGRFETFMRLLAGRVGQLVNLSALSNDVGVSSTTLGDWLSALETSFIVLRLYPYYANIRKRLIKTPKLYFTEPGLLAWLLQIESPAQIARDPLIGGMYENLVVMEAVKGAYNRDLEPRLSFYRDKSGVEIDLIREYQRRPLAVEIKAAATFTPEMRRPIDRFRSIHPDPAGAAVIYSGPTQRNLAEIGLWNHRDTAELLFGT